jgi:hypothetical protein
MSHDESAALDSMRQTIRWLIGGIASLIGGAAFRTNTTYYRYYRIKKTAGAVNGAPWAYQFEFKISA